MPVINTNPLLLKESSLQLAHNFNEENYDYYAYYPSNDSQDEYEYDEMEEEYGGYEPLYENDSTSTDREELLHDVVYDPRRAIERTDESIFDKDFVAQALKYNPLAYDALPAPLQKSQAVIDIYRDVLYGDGYQEHPEVSKEYNEAVHELEKAYDKDNHDSWAWDELYADDFNEELDEIQRPAVNFLLNPHCPLDKLCTPEGYEQVFGHVMKNSSQHAIQPQDPYGFHAESSLSVEFLAKCRDAFPERAERYDVAEFQAYEKNKHELQEMLTREPNSMAQVNLAEFCCDRGLPPMPAWQQEFNLIQQGISARHVAQLQELSHVIEEDRRQPSHYIAQIHDIMDKVPMEIIKENFDINAYWEHVGAEMHSNDMIIQDPESDFYEIGAAREDQGYIEQFIDSDKPWSNAVKNAIDTGWQKAETQHQIIEQKGNAFIAETFERD